VASTIEVPVSDGTALPLYEVSPGGQPSGVVVVIQEAFGVNDHIEDVARRFADAGFRAVAPHLFHRTGDPRLGYERFADTLPHMQALTAGGLAADIDATVKYLQDAGVADSRIGFVGFCMGGIVALTAAVTRPIGAAVTFYGGGGPPLVDLAPLLRAPWLGLYGDEDQGIPINQVEALGEAAARAGVPTEILRYPGAGHGFHCEVRASYHEAAALDAWARCVGWLDEYLNRPVVPA